MMKTKTVTEILSGIEAGFSSSTGKIRINAIQYDSRKIEPGNLFVAVRGFKSDGHQFLDSVAQSGAACAVVEEINTAVNLPQIVAKDSRKTMARLAANFYRPEIDKLILAGVTGTNGKTSVSFLLRSILNAAGLDSGMIGTIAYFYGNKSIPAWNTTPEAADICRMLYELTKQRQKACVLEVSSHALSLNRVDGLKFDVAVFTNLSRDHLDFHKDEKNYFAAKRRLFFLLKEQGTAVVNIDDPYGAILARELDKNIISFGFSEQAPVRPLKWHTSLQGIELRLRTPAGDFDIHSELIGEYNIQNIMAAVSAALALQISPQAVREGIKSVKRIPGRLETYPLGDNILAVIDYAHTPDALQKALHSLEKICPGRLVVVFGAGGDRDRGKRPLMGKIAEEIADLVIVTSDNPRTENPRDIINDILSGMILPQKRQVIENRENAIKHAIQSALPNDVILIAGKGHETYQDMMGVKRPFNEAEIIKQAALHVSDRIS